MTTSVIPAAVPAARPAVRVGLQRILAYFALAYLGTWVTFAPLMFDPTLSVSLFAFLFVLSTFTGPALAAIVVTAATEGWQGVRSLLGRALRWRVGLQWYGAAAFGFLLVWLVGYSIALDGAPLKALLAQPQTLITVFIPFIVTTSLIPAIGEEIGWRGYALPALQGRFGPLGGTLILGLLHSLWHLPAFFTPIMGPFAPLSFLTFVLTGVAGTFIYTWISNNARNSILIAVLIHAAGNASSALLGGLVAGVMPSNDLFLNLITSGWFNVILFWTVAIVLLVLTRGRLGYHRSDAAR